MSPDRQRDANPYPRDDEMPPMWGAPSSFGHRLNELERRTAHLEGEVGAGRETLIRLEERLGQALEDIRLMRRDMAGIKRTFYLVGTGLMLAMLTAILDLSTQI